MMEDRVIPAEDGDPKYRAKTFGPYPGSRWPPWLVGSGIWRLRHQAVWTALRDTPLLAHRVRQEDVALEGLQAGWPSPCYGTTIHRSRSTMSALILATARFVKCAGGRAVLLADTRSPCQLYPVRYLRM